MAPHPEMQLLALCLPSGSKRLRDADDLTAMFPALDWSKVLNLARLHGMVPLLASYFAAASQQQRSSVPAFVLTELHTFQQQHLFRSLSQTAGLIELQREFNRCGVPLLTWKGPSMAILLYGSASFRESVDLDFLFTKESIGPTLEIARRLGYRLMGSTDSETRDVYVRTQECEFTFGRRRDQLVLEFHLQTLPSRFSRWQDSEAAIQRASTVLALADVELTMLSTEDLLVSLCAHATKHNWDRMKWSCDIAQFLHLYEGKIDWASFLQRLHSEKKDRAVLLGLAVTANLFTLKLSPEALSALGRSPTVVALAGDITAHLMNRPAEMIDLQHRKAVIRILCPRIRDRIIFWLRPNLELNYDDLYIPIHHPAFFLNYFLRAVRLLRKYGPHRLASKTAGSVRSVR